MIRFLHFVERKRLVKWEIVVQFLRYHECVLVLISSHEKWLAVDRCAILLLGT